MNRRTRQVVWNLPMRIYQIEGDDEWKKASGHWIDAGYDLGLPGVHCPRCDERWAAYGLAYPSVDVSTLRSVSKRELTPRNVPWDEYVDIRDRLRSGLGPGYLDGTRAVVYPVATVAALAGVALVVASVMRPRRVPAEDL